MAIQIVIFLLFFLCMIINNFALSRFWNKVSENHENYTFKTFLQNYLKKSNPRSDRLEFRRFVITVILTIIVFTILTMICFMINSFLTSPEEW